MESLDLKENIIKFLKDNINDAVEKRENKLTIDKNIYNTVIKDLYNFEENGYTIKEEDDKIIISWTLTKNYMEYINECDRYFTNDNCVKLLNYVNFSIDNYNIYNFVKTSKNETILKHIIDNLTIVKTENKDIIDIISCNSNWNIVKYVIEKNYVDLNSKKRLYNICTHGDKEIRFEKIKYFVENKGYKLDDEEKLQILEIIYEIDTFKYLSKGFDLSNEKYLNIILYKCISGSTLLNKYCINMILNYNPLLLYKNNTKQKIKAMCGQEIQKIMEFIRKKIFECRMKDYINNITTEDNIIKAKELNNKYDKYGYELYSYDNIKWDNIDDKFKYKFTNFLKDEFDMNGDDFCKYLNGDCVVSGGIILPFLNLMISTGPVQYFIRDCNDIDIFIDIRKYDNKRLDEFITFLNLNCFTKYETEENKKNEKSYYKNLGNIERLLNFKHYKTNIMVQLICVKKDVIESMNDFDIDICKNFFDGDVLYMNKGNIDKLTSKEFNVKVKEGYSKTKINERINKYIKKGLKFNKITVMPNK
jgi:hypothetical protein